MKKVQLERILQSLEALPSPRPDLEQYPTPAALAAEVAHMAHGRGDIEGRRVLDPGCGNGVLAVAAKLLGAVEVVGVDVDPRAIAVAVRNEERAYVDIEWRHGDVSSVEGSFDTVLMNPPFGSQKKHADLPFLDKALEVSRVVYSFHNRQTQEFLTHHIGARGARITQQLAYELPVRRMFRFHTDEVRRIPVLLLRIEVLPRMAR